MERDDSAFVADDTRLPAVDEAILSELFALLADESPDSLMQACELFLNDVPTRLAAAASALAEERFDDAADVAHSVRGSAGAFGALRLSRLADRLEHACGHADVGSARRIVEAMTGELVAFRTVLTARLASLPSR